MKRNFTAKVGLFAGLLATGGLAMAQSTTVDYTPIVAAVSLAGVTAAIVSMGGVKIIPNVTKWATNKLVGFFR